MQQAEVVQNHETEHVRTTGQGETKENSPRISNTEEKNLIIVLFFVLIFVIFPSFASILTYYQKSRYGEAQPLSRPHSTPRLLYHACK
jgi:hypothetical protein